MLESLPIMSLPQFDIFKDHFCQIEIKTGTLTVYESYVKQKEIFKMIFTSSNSLSVEGESTRIVELDFERFMKISNDQFADAAGEYQII